MKRNKSTFESENLVVDWIQHTRINLYEQNKRIVANNDQIFFIPKFSIINKGYTSFLS